MLLLRRLRNCNLETSGINAAAAETASTADRIIEFIDFDELRRRNRHDDELSYAIARVHFKGLMRIEVNENDFQLSAVVAVDETWRVHDGYAMLCRKTRTRQDETSIAFRYRDCDAAGDHLALERLENRVFGGTQVEPRISSVSVLRGLERIVKLLNGYR